MGKVARAPGAPTADPTSASKSTTPEFLQGYKPVEKPSVTVAELQEEGAKVRDLLVEKKDHEERIKKINIDIQKATFRTLPEMLSNAKVPGITVAAEGNKSAYKFTLDDYVYANIKAEWEPEKRETGFKTVRELGGESIIKGEITIYVPKGSEDYARRIVAGLDTLIANEPEAGITYEHHENVQHNTLSAWLREYIETTGEVPSSEQLEALGATVGKQVKVKEIKKDTKPPSRR
jgi:predicted RNA-binding protein